MTFEVKCPVEIGLDCLKWDWKFMLYFNPVIYMFMQGNVNYM